MGGSEGLEGLYHVPHVLPFYMCLKEKSFLFFFFQFEPPSVFTEACKYKGWGLIKHRCGL